MKSPYLALAALLLPALPAQAQTGLEAFNPLTFLAPIMTPLGAMLVPMQAPMAAPQAQFNPAALFNPTAFNGMQMPVMPNYGAPQGMVPFTGLQATPQSFGMAPQQNMPNPFVGNPFFGNPYASQPMAFPSLPTQNGFPGFPGFPIALPTR